MADLKFTSPTSRNIPVKPSLTKFTDSRLRPHVVTSEGIFSDRPFPPYFALPVLWKDVTTEDWVVLNKGTIVSALTNVSVDPKNNSTTGTTHIGNPDLSGIVYLGLGVDGVMRQSYVDSQYWGYEEYIAGLMVPCNGGAASWLPYSTDDVSQTITVSGSYVTAANVTASYALPLAINKPIGVTYQDIYQDLEGRYLNYGIENRSKYGVVHDRVIEIPYVNAAILTAANNIEGMDLSSYTFTEATSGATNLYVAVYKKYPFAYFSATANAIPGTWLKSDKYGKFMLFTDESSGESQLVGKIIVTDTRFPKGNLEFVDTYEGSNVPGTATGGLPYVLFAFCYDLLAATSVTPSISAIVNLVHSGAVGMITINLQVA